MGGPGALASRRRFEEGLLGLVAIPAGALVQPAELAVYRASAVQDAHYRYLYGRRLFEPELGAADALQARTAAARNKAAPGLVPWRGADKQIVESQADKR